MIPFRSRTLFLSLVLGFPVWASSSVPGIHNFYEIDQKVCRGAQPTGDGFKYLARIGVKVVVDLRGHDSRSAAEERTVTNAGMRYVNVPMTGLTPPSQADITTILTLLEDPASGPVFVHCRRGADRTGAVIAAYRIDHYKWDNARALHEAMSDGMSWFQFPRQKYIRSFQARVPDAAPAAAAEALFANPGGGSAPALAVATAAAAR